MGNESHQDPARDMEVRDIDVSPLEFSDPVAPYPLTGGDTSGGIVNEYGDHGSVLEVLSEDGGGGDLSKDPLEPLAFTKTGETWTVTHEPGTFSYTVPEADAPIEVTDVLVNGSPISDLPAPKLTVASGDVVYLYFKTDERGKPELLEGGTYSELKVDAPLKESIHHVPKDEDLGGGTKGEYWIEIYSVVLSDGVMTVNQSSPQRYGNYDWDIGYEQIENLGGAGKVYKKADGTKGVLEFRGIDGDYGITLNPFGTVISLEFDGENIGDGAEVFNDAAGFAEDPAEFRTLVGAGPSASDVGVKVEPNGDVIEFSLQGGINQTLGVVTPSGLGQERALVQFTDGLAVGKLNLNSLDLDVCVGTGSSKEIKTYRVVITREIT
jgi:hypothetical protein